MFATIYKPSRTAMQSGTANVEEWRLEFERQSARRTDPLMGWTSSDDTKSDQVRLTFDTKAAAIAYAKSQNIPYRVAEARDPAPVAKAYSDNFAFRRRKPWTH